MSAKSLAISLSGFAELFDAVNKEVGGDGAKVDLSFVASRAGSVEFILELIEMGLPAGALIAPELSSYASEICKQVVGKNGLFALIPRLRMPSSSRGIVSNPGVIEERADGSRSVIDKEVAMEHPQIAELAIKKPVQESAWKSVHPVATGACKSLDIVNGPNPITKVDGNNVGCYRPIPPEDSVAVRLVEMEMIVLEVVFEGDTLWKMRTDYAENPISCRVTDAEFLAEIGNGLRFGKGDVIDAVVKVTSILSGTDSKTRRTYELIKVISHRDPTLNWSEPLYSSPSRLL